MLLNRQRKRLAFRQGFSLLEVGLAIIIISMVLVTATTTVLEALNLQVEADRLALAMGLAQEKMSELRSDHELKTTDNSGEINDEKDIYDGYSWKASIAEEKLNLAELLESNFGDLFLGEEELNQSKEEKVGGGKQGLFSLGDMPILRISIEIKYPKGKGAFGYYNLETLQRLPRSSGFSSPR